MNLTKGGSMKTKTTKGHLCNNCLHVYPDCAAEDIEFGNGPGEDNIIDCSCYLGSDTTDDTSVKV